MARDFYSVFAGSQSRTESQVRLLDLFCGAGGAAMGYHQAGFEVVGVDIKPQPRYPFEFHQGDALEFLRDHGHEFDVIHASPPCQAFSVATKADRRHMHADLVAPTRDLLNETGKPWVMENVPGAPLCAHFKLTGRQFGLKLARARLFETNWAPLVMSPPVVYDGEVITVVGHGTPGWAKKKLGRNPSIEEKRDAMGIYWMNRNELSQAIPPAYTKFIGEQLMLELRRAA